MGSTGMVVWGHANRESNAPVIKDCCLHVIWYIWISQLYSHIYIYVYITGMLLRPISLQGIRTENTAKMNISVEIALSSHGIYLMRCPIFSKTRCHLSFSLGKHSQLQSIKHIMYFHIWYYSGFHYFYWYGWIFIKIKMDMLAWGQLSVSHCNQMTMFGGGGGDEYIVCHVIQWGVIVATPTSGTLNDIRPASCR